MDALKTIAMDLLIAGLLAFGAWLLRTRKQQLIATINNLILMAEEGIKGSKLGEKRKAWVMAQLAVAKIRVTPAISVLIDKLVEIMNTKKTSLTETAEAVANETIDSVIGDSQ